MQCPVAFAPFFLFFLRLVYLSKHDFSKCFPNVDLEFGMAESLGAEIRKSGLNILIGDVLNLIDAIHEDDSILNRTHSTCRQ